MRRFAFVGLLAACTSPLGGARQELTAQVKTERYTLIRDSAAQMGQNNAALLAGIAISETGLAHCYDEAPSFSCPGPASSSCGGTAVIAGGADGPCSAMQGGLGMFQFDAGTYSDTVNTYGPQILTVEGNTAQAVWFVTDKVEQDIAGAADWMSAMAWMNQIKLDAADPVMNQWAQLLACHYNGCCTTSATCTSRANGYRDNAITAYNDMGAAFWDESHRCTELPKDSVIDERSACYIAGGDPRYWHHETAGYGGTLEWTLTTSAAAPANFAEWIVKTGRAGRYHVDVNLDGGTFGQAKLAHYQIAHAGKLDTVTVDQSSASGFVSLGDFDFAGSGDEHVLLADDTGEVMKQLLFDAVRVQSLDGPGPAPASGGCGGCAAGGGSGGALVVLVLVLGRRRRR